MSSLREGVEKREEEYVKSATRMTVFTHHKTSLHELVARDRKKYPLRSNAYTVNRCIVCEQNTWNDIPCDSMWEAEKPIKYAWSAFMGNWIDDKNVILLLLPGGCLSLLPRCLGIRAWIIIRSMSD